MLCARRARQLAERLNVTPELPAAAAHSPVGW